MPTFELAQQLKLYLEEFEVAKAPLPAPQDTQIYPWIATVIQG